MSGTGTYLRAMEGARKEVEEKSHGCGEEKGGPSHGCGADESIGLVRAAAAGEPCNINHWGGAYLGAFVPTTGASFRYLQCPNYEAGRASLDSAPCLFVTIETPSAPICRWSSGFDLKVSVHGLFTRIS